MDYEDDDWDEDSYDDGYDDLDDEEGSTIPCPDCGADIYEDADACPHCGTYLYHGYHAGSYYPWYTFGGAVEWSPFWIFLAMLGILATMFALMAG